MLGSDFCDVTLTAKKPQKKAYPITMKTIGDHVRKSRLDLKLYQKDVAKVIGLDMFAVCNWENNLTSPQLYILPKVFDFLGYTPLQRNKTTLRGKIRQYRIENGLSLRRSAKEVGVDPGTLAKWERGRFIQSLRSCSG